MTGDLFSNLLTGKAPLRLEHLGQLIYKDSLLVPSAGDALEEALADPPPEAAQHSTSHNWHVRSRTRPPSRPRPSGPTSGFATGRPHVVIGDVGLPINDEGVNTPDEPRDPWADSDLADEMTRAARAQLAHWALVQRAKCDLIDARARQQPVEVEVKVTVAGRRSVGGYGYLLPASAWLDLAVPPDWLERVRASCVDLDAAVVDVLSLDESGRPDTVVALFVTDDQGDAMLQAQQAAVHRMRGADPVLEPIAPWSDR